MNKDKNDSIASLFFSLLFIGFGILMVTGEYYIIGFLSTLLGVLGLFAQNGRDNTRLFEAVFGALFGLVFLLTGLGLLYETALEWKWMVKRDGALSMIFWFFFIPTLLVIGCILIKKAFSKRVK